MDSLHQLLEFFGAAANDPRISPTHISLYLTLYQKWIMNHCVDPVHISRSDVMKTSKISGIATYHKCIKDLHEYGYIKYMPSYNRRCNTRVYLFP